MSPEIIRILLIMLAMAMTMSAGRSEDYAFPKFDARVAELLRAEDPGADKMKLTFTNPGVAQGAATLYGANATIAVEKFDARACQFTIRVQSAQIVPTLLTGECNAFAVVPAPVRDLRPGDVIADADITMIDEPASRTTANTIRDKSKLLGLTPRQVLSTGRPIASTAVKRKSVIAKGDAVTIRFVSNGLELTAMGQALGEAALGDPVAIINTRSRKTIEAVATGPGTAEARSTISAQFANIQNSIQTQ